jgi:hypothetical protein
MFFDDLAGILDELEAYSKRHPHSLAVRNEGPHAAVPFSGPPLFRSSLFGLLLQVPDL